MEVTVEEAIALVEQNTSPMEEEFAPLAEAPGRLLTREVRSNMAQPPFDRSPLDGYAVIAADLAGASRERPAHLRVVEKLYAGDTPRVSLQRGQAARLMTGSMIPEGADCVIRQEDTDGGEEEVQLYQEVGAGANFCRRGEEYQAGTVLLPQGTRVDAAAAAVAAGAGQTALPVRRRVRAAILSTGDELQPAGAPLRPGKIYDSNAAYLSARLRQLGVRVGPVLTARDDVPQTLAALEQCSQADVIFTTGGVSVGQKDLLRTAAEAFGAEVIFHGIRIKPGMPTLFARREKLLLLGLSGNPFAAAVPFELLVRPLLARALADAEIGPRHGLAVTQNGFLKSSPSRRFLRAFERDGQVSLPEEQANGQMRSMIGCNCLVDIPAGSGPVLPGETVRVVWL